MKTSHTHPIKQWAMKKGVDHSDKNLSSLVGVTQSYFNKIVNCHILPSEAVINRFHLATNGKVTGKAVTNFYWDNKTDKDDDQ